MEKLHSLICFILASTANNSLAANIDPTKNWVAVQGAAAESSLEVQAGSILDFSGIANTPAITSESQRLIINEQGQISLASAPDKPLKFLMGSWAFGPAEGGFPSKQEITRYVKQYKLHGYNMMRIGHLELMLMQGQPRDFQFNPTQLDRFYFLVSELKRNGMYIIVEGLTTGNGGLGDDNLGGKSSSRFLGYNNLARRVYFDEEVQQHWKNLAQAMYGQVNPYSKTSLLEDPVLAGFILSNENSIAFHLMLDKASGGNAYPDWLKPHFNQWLLKKYKRTSAVKQAWSEQLSPQQSERAIANFNELQPYESLEKANIYIADYKRGKSPRLADFQQFIWETELKTTQWMTVYLRDSGYKGLITAYNNHRSPATHASRSQLDWVDIHEYFAHPTHYIEQNSFAEQKSMLGDKATYIQWMAYSRHFGKPFTVSEHGQVFWNQYRREAGLALPAYAALQSWDGINQHANQVQLKYSSTTGQRREVIMPFSVGLDPISRATETLSALIYLRGDVMPANKTIGAKFTADDAFKNSDFETYPPRDVSKLSLIHGLALDWQGLTASKAIAKTGLAPYIAQVSINEPGKLTLFNRGATVVSAKPIVNTNIYSNEYEEETWAARVKNLRDTHLIDANNLTNAALGIYQSDTGQLTLDSRNKQMTVITDKTEAVVFSSPKPITLNNLSVLSAEDGALVAVSVMDKNKVTTLANSQRLLITLSTDARNTGMRFTDDTNSTLLALGTQPILIKPVKVKLRLNNINSHLLKVYSVDLRGQRQDSISVVKIKNSAGSVIAIEFELDIRQLRHGATTYFEINTN